MMGRGSSEQVLVCLVDKMFPECSHRMVPMSCQCSSMIVHVPSIPPHIPMPVELQRAHGHCIQALEGCLVLAKCHYLQSVLAN